MISQTKASLPTPLFTRLFSAIQKLTLLALMLTISTANGKEIHIQAIDAKIDIPASFSSASNFTGFINPHTFTTIRYQETIQGFSAAKQSLLTSLNDIQEQQPIKVSNKQGVLIRHNSIIDGNPFELWTLLFGDKISAINITASYPKTMAAKSADIMLATLKTVRWLRLPSEQIFIGLPFVADQSADLKITQRNVNAIVMMDKTPYDQQKAIPPMIVLSVGHSEQPLETIATFSKSLLQTKRVSDDLTILNQQAVSISGIQGYQITATTTDKITGKQAKILQTIIYEKHRYLLVQGIVETAQAEHFWPQFKAITQSVKFK